MKNLSNFEVQYLYEGVELRVLRPGGNFSEYKSWLNDPEINQYLESRTQVPFNEKMIVEFVDTVYKSNNTLLFGIYYQDEHVGNIKIGPINNTHKTAYIGYVIGKKSIWGKGVASKAILACCHIGFKQLGLLKINAGVMEGNIGSEKVLEKCGFKLEANLRNMLFNEKLKRNVNQKIYGKTSEDV